MKKLLLLGMLFTACSPMKQTKRGIVTYVYNPRVWTVENVTTEDSIKLDSLIKLNN